MGATATELKAEVATIGHSLVALEKRMEPIEADTKTAAKGVEVLCELVKTSGLLSNASADSLRRLDNFTGGPAPSTRELPAPPPTRELLPPAGGQSALASDLAGAAPTFMRALMEPPTFTVPTL